MVTQTTSLQGALILACRPGCGPVWMRLAGPIFSPSPLAGCAATWWAQSGRLVECLGALSEGLGRGGSVAVFGCGVVLCAGARYLGREFVPQAEVLSFASPKESTQRKGDPGYAPCGFPALLEIRGGCGTRFAQTVLADYPAPSCDARRSSREPVRGGASHRATFNGFFGGQQAAHPTQAGQAWLLASLWISPVGHAEHRSPMRGSPRGLFEQSPQGFASSAAAALDEKRRVTRSAAEGVTSGSPSLGYLSWRDKKGTVLAGHPRHPNQLRVSAPNPIAFGYPSTESRISLHSIRATTASWVSLRSTQPTAVFAISQPHHCRRRQA
jgi:hypothetical protein